MFIVVPPIPDRDDRFFWDGVNGGRLLLSRCARCHTLCHPPVPMCGECLSTSWGTLTATGRGTVHSWIVSRHPTRPDDDPRIVALIALDEGVRLVSNLVDIEAIDVRNDMAVELTFRDYGSCVLPQFRPVQPT